MPQKMKIPGFSPDIVIAGVYKHNFWIELVKMEIPQGHHCRFMPRWYLFVSKRIATEKIIVHYLIGTI